jgi:hypothetical protein
MTPDAVAVITYPGHCVSTLLTIKNLHNLTSWQVPFYVFVDDLGDQFTIWQGNYIDHIQDYYSDLPVQLEFIKFSDFGFGPIWDGWLRQQLVKLNIDKFLPGDTWYVTDGDVYATKLIECNTIPYHFVPKHNRQIYNQNCNYIRHILQHDDIYLEVNGRNIFTHHVPYRWILRNVLQELKLHSNAVCKSEFNTNHWSLMKSLRILGLGNDDNMSMTEWDLLEVFKIKILKQTCVYEHYPFGENFHTFFGTDKDLDLTWIDIPKHIQQNINTILRA